jgi:hypothetical protein
MKFLKNSRFLVMVMVMVLAGQCAYAQVNGPSTQKLLSVSFVPANQTVEVQQPSQGTDLHTVALLSGVGFFVILLLAGGLGFTVREFKRLSAKSLGCSMTVNTIRKGRTGHAAVALQRVF